MEGAILVLPLVGIALPIVMLLGALLFDAVVALWALYRVVHDRASRSGRTRAPAESTRKHRDNTARETRPLASLYRSEARL